MTNPYPDPNPDPNPNPTTLNTTCRPSPGQTLPPLTLTLGAWIMAAKSLSKDFNEAMAGVEG